MVLVKAGDFTMGSTEEEIQQIKNEFSDLESKLLERNYPNIRYFWIHFQYPNIRLLTLILKIY